MGIFEGISLEAKNYKSFGEEGCKFEEIKQINVIIGRNNSGKSTMVDVVEIFAHKRQINGKEKHQEHNSSFFITKPLTEIEIREVFGNAVVDERYDSVTYWSLLGERLIGTLLKMRFYGLYQFSELQGESEKIAYLENNFGGYLHRDILQHLKSQIRELRISNPLSGRPFIRLHPERDIRPELSSRHRQITENGEGLTALIEHIVHDDASTRPLVKGKMLRKLNEIFGSDAQFSDIQPLRNPDNNHWEIFLEEKNKGAISLGNSGSGLKTILLIITFMEVMPSINGNELKDYIFAFEELENNLHPALLRRLLAYIRDKVVNEGCHIFLTTHSNVVIDFFSKDPQAQIIHVTHCGETAKAQPVKTYFEHNGILDDLDVRASDLLQANGVIWLEGPSDRLYFNKWVELWSNGTLREGEHYQCVYYGGRLLAHLDASDPDSNSSEAIKILRINRNAIMIMDSDRRNEASSINATKKRIQEEMQEKITWITKGKEIENYLPLQALQKVYPDTKLQEPPGQYEDIKTYLNEKVNKKAGERFSKDKCGYAEKFVQHLKKEDLVQMHDLNEKMTAIAKEIKRWNGIN